MKNICEDDFVYVENFVQIELVHRLSEQFTRKKSVLIETDKINFFGDYVSNVEDFTFSALERSLIYRASECLKNQNAVFNPSKAVLNSVNSWFYNHIQDEPKRKSNLLSKMNQAAEKNSLKPKQGYRYDSDLRRFCVHNRILSGPTAFKALQANLNGCFPSISTTNRYIHRSDHVIIEGQLRSEELLNYLNDNSQELYVSISEDATRVENRVQYDSRTNQLIGFVLPLDGNGMPIPFCYKARHSQEIMQHFSRNISAASFINTIMAKPLGNAPAFCLLVFGSDNRYTADDSSKRWIFIKEELKKIGITALTMSTDSDPKFNTAMKINSGLGTDPEDCDPNLNGIFKCDLYSEPPFNFQDIPHIATKLRNLLLKTIDEPQKLPFGKFFIQQHHLKQLIDMVSKDKHLLTASTLNPMDRQNYESARKICDIKVIELLTNCVDASDGTVMFLQILSDVIASFEDQNLSPLQRIEKMWGATFLVRIWRHFVLNEPGLTLKNNFMSNLCYLCFEYNAHSLVSILLYLKKNNLTHLFLPHMYSSQPCESFYRQIRSLSSVSSTVVNCSTKGMLDRISRTQLLSDISNDRDNGSVIIYPKSFNSCEFSQTNDVKSDFPNEIEIVNAILKCKADAIQKAMRIGLLKKKYGSKNEACVCNVKTYAKRPRKNEIHDSSDSESEDDFGDVYMKVVSSSIKNYANKFEEKNVSETSPYVEVFGDDKRFVFRKTSLCWLLGKERTKCSSDRIYRVRHTIQNKTRKIKASKLLKNMSTEGKRTNRIIYRVRKTIKKKIRKIKSNVQIAKKYSTKQK